MSIRRLLAVLVVSCSCQSLLSSNALYGQLTFRTVAITGAPAPGVFGETFAPISTSSKSITYARSLTLNNLGQTSFKVELSDGRESLYTEATSAGLRLIALQGDAPTASPENGEFAYFNNRFMILNDQGTTAYSGGFTIPGDNERHSGIWTFDDILGTQLVARGADPLPGQEDRAFSDRNVEIPLLNRGGLVGGHLASFSNEIRSVVLGNANSALQTVATTGTQEDFVFPIATALSDAGHVVLETHHSGVVSWDLDDNDPHRGVWLYENGALNQLARTQDETAGFHFGHLRDAHLNSVGDVAFVGMLDEAPYDTGIYRKSSGDDLRVAIQVGDTAPETGGAMFGGGFDAPLLDTDGRLVFAADLEDGRRGIWRETAGGELDMLALVGDAVPNEEESDWVGIWEYASNRHGQLVFSATFGDVTDPAAARKAYWIVQPGGEMSPIVAEGDAIDVGGQLRTIFQLGLLPISNNEDGRQSRFNDLGQIAFAAQFTDGTVGHFVSIAPPGDTNSDGLVNLHDLNNVRNNFGGVGLGDTDRDGDIDIDDLNNVRNNFGAVPTASVPEPGMAGMALIGTASILTRRRRLNRWQL